MTPACLLNIPSLTWFSLQWRQEALLARLRGLVGRVMLSAWTAIHRRQQKATQAVNFYPSAIFVIQKEFRKRRLICRSIHAFQTRKKRNRNI
ncbi:hypothetical protein E2C01_046295 [Portunus trituberculatus]|uniref:Uncharacterized protein n=1 Tax=Portunus trituberculatus TaxID=210409 RepID=A0A5B7G406_PORTR|nr:hypothetical protein [Portunus trituberculatus]